MTESISSQVKVLKDIEDALRNIPAFLMPTGKGVQSPKYHEQTQQLEALMAELSLAIRRIQASPHSKGPDAQKALKMARHLEERIKEAEGRAVERSMHELLADGLNRIHQYHALIETPDHSHSPVTAKPEPVEVYLIILFSILARYVQCRKRAQESG